MGNICMYIGAAVILAILWITLVVLIGSTIEMFRNKTKENR